MLEKVTNAMDPNPTLYMDYVHCELLLLLVLLQYHRKYKLHLRKNVQWPGPHRVKEQWDGPSEEMDTKATN